MLACSLSVHLSRSSLTHVSSCSPLAFPFSLQPQAPACPPSPPNPPNNEHTNSRRPASSRTRAGARLSPHLHDRANPGRCTSHASHIQPCTMIAPGHAHGWVHWWLPSPPRRTTTLSCVIKPALACTHTTAHGCWKPMQHTCGQLPAQYTRQRPSSDRAQHRTPGHGNLSEPCMCGFASAAGAPSHSQTNATSHGRKGWASGKGGSAGAADGGGRTVRCVGGVGRVCGAA